MVAKIRLQDLLNHVNGWAAVLTQMKYYLEYGVRYLHRQHVKPIKWTQNGHKPVLTTSHRRSKGLKILYSLIISFDIRKKFGYTWLMITFQIRKKLGEKRDEAINPA